MNFFDNISRKISQKLLPYNEFVKNAHEQCKKLQQESIVDVNEEDQNYSIDIAKKELGLDDVLIDSLIEDYVAQIISNIPLFKKYAKDSDTNLTTLKELAHKNLGVARNLRIKDMQKILKEIMNTDDRESLLKCIDYLEACAIVLKPKIAYKAYRKR